MGKNGYNNDFFGYKGKIGRKNYLINMLILVAMYIAISCIQFDSLIQYITFKLIYSLLIWTVEVLKFVIIMSAISLVYRRIQDFASTKTQNFNDSMKRIFIYLFVFPTLYIFCIRYAIGIIPNITALLDTLTFLVLVPIGIVFAITISSIKGSWYF